MTTAAAVSDAVRLETDAEAPGSRELTLAETEVLRQFDLACRQLGLNEASHSRVTDGIEAELRRRLPTPDEQAGLDTTPEHAWSEIGAAASVATLAASDVPQMKRRRRRHPAGAGIEPLEVASMPSRALFQLYVRRFILGLRKRRPWT